MDHYYLGIFAALVWVTAGVVPMVWYVFSSWAEVSLFDLILALLAGFCLGPILGICFLLHKIKLKGGA